MECSVSQFQICIVNQLFGFRVLGQASRAIVQQQQQQQQLFSSRLESAIAQSAAQVAVPSELIIRVRDCLCMFTHHRIPLLLLLPSSPATLVQELLHNNTQTSASRTTISSQVLPLHTTTPVAVSTQEIRCETNKVTAVAIHLCSIGTRVASQQDSIFSQPY